MQKKETHDVAHQTRRAPPAPPCMRPPLPTELQSAFPSPAACFSMASRGHDLLYPGAGCGGESSSLRFSMASCGCDLPCPGVGFGGGPDAGSDGGSAVGAWPCSGGGVSSSLLTPILHGWPWMRPPLPRCGLRRRPQCRGMGMLH
jgi:hypothetical protein